MYSDISPSLVAKVAAVGVGWVHQAKSVSKGCSEFGEVVTRLK